MTKQQRDRARYLAQREAIRTRHAAYRTANRAAIRAQQAEYRAANREKIAARKAARRAGIQVSIRDLTLDDAQFINEARRVARMSIYGSALAGVPVAVRKSNYARHRRAQARAGR